MIGNPLLLSLSGILIYFLAGSVAREAITHANVVSIRDWLLYQVSVQIHNRHICGGGIIGEQIVLTAAFCFVNRTRHLRNTHISVLAKTLDLHKTRRPAVRIRVETIFVPKDFNPQIRTVLIGDIAVLKLSHSLPEITEEHRMRLLLPLNADRPNRILSTIGYGWSSNDVNDNDGFAATDGRLRYALFSELSDEECESAFPRGAIHSDAHRCAKGVGDLRSPHPPSVCTGDAGGPLIGLAGVTRHVHGILSRIPDDCDGERQPAVFTLVHRYAQNIRNVVERGHDANMISLQAN